MAVSARKGQFFVIGALLLISLIAGIIVLNVSEFTGPKTQTPKQLFDQSFHTFPNAVNAILAENRSISEIEQQMTSYLAFQQYTLQSHALQNKAHTVLSVPNGDNVTVLLTNFRHAPLQNVQITVDGTTKTASAVPPQESAVITFQQVPATFTVDVAFDAERSFDQQFTGYSGRVAALYALRVEGEDQVWQSTKTY